MIRVMVALALYAGAMVAAGNHSAFGFILLIVAGTVVLVRRPTRF